MTDPKTNSNTNLRASEAAPENTGQLAFRVHARALAALGRDLVTDDVVAVMELVKNSYDALATRVVIRIRPEREPTGGQGYIEVVDDGHGMDYDTVRDVWCVIATPLRAERPLAGSGSRIRAVTGQKGLGRLAAARLGDSIRVRTKKEGDSPLEFSFAWTDLYEIPDIGKASIRISQAPDSMVPANQGTAIRIGSLRSEWDHDKIQALGADLARLISPFGADDFEIRLDAPGRDGAINVRSIRLPEYMSEPKYRIVGQVDVDGAISWRYRYRPIGGGAGREESRVERPSDGQVPESACGPFEFEIRAWDLSVDDTRDMADHYSEARSRIRGLIKEHRGISLYRDDVLVLPKSDRARDWLGLDLRRVSRVGTRLSTSQIVGYARITRAKNPLLWDTSDRERLVDNPAFSAFRASMLRAVEILEIERDADRDRIRKKESAKDLFANVTAAPLVSRMEDLREEGASVDDAILTVRAFAGELERARTDIERRFGYYNRLAVVGTIAQIVIHEIRSHTMVIGRSIRKAAEVAKRIGDKPLGRAAELAGGSASALEGLADRFAPLARRGYRPSRRLSILEEEIGRCCEMLAPELRSHGIKLENPGNTETRVRIDPGELDSVILNLMTNSIYWMSTHIGERRLRFRVSLGSVVDRITVSVDDTGPGIDVRDRDRVFRPGWTRKPEGIGMGLVVASELIEDRGGKMRTSIPGELGGATFEFDLPLADGGAE
ncbi:MAG: sensor histidine kinase [Gammaproteobacteria bacterium]|nr:sensor histidine kinase [Gammaproteobacteria bacterium]